MPPAVAMHGAKERRASAPLRRLAFCLFALFFVAYGVFTQDIVSHNTLCRAAMVANLVQSGRVDINGYEGYTEDKAQRNGNYYCDKAPGMSFLAVPAAFVFTRIVPVTPETPFGRTWLAFLYVCALTTSAVLSAAAAVALFYYTFDHTGDLRGALLASLAFGLGTPVWGWSTSFFSHAAAASLLVVGFIALDAARRRLAADGRALPCALLAGLALGTATAVEYTAIVPAAIMGCVLAIQGLKGSPARMLQVGAVAALGGLAALAPVLLFHAAAFGSPFTTGYAFTVVYDAHRSGLFGIGLPDLVVLAKLLVSTDRGAVWFAPVVLATGWATARMMRYPDLRPPAIVIILIAAWYLLMNAGFGYWHGGASTGPRYLTPAIGFSALALGLAWPTFGRAERRASIALLGLSIVINLACAAVDMTAGSLIERIVPRFVSGDLQHTLTYRLYKHPSLLHFLVPLACGAALTWLVVKAAQRAEAELRTAGGARLAMSTKGS